jgi:hypothetical protein
MKKERQIRWLLNVDLVRCSELDQKINGPEAYTLTDLEVLNRIPNKRNWILIVDDKDGWRVAGFLLAEVIPETNKIDIYKIVAEDDKSYMELVERMSTQRSEANRHLEAIIAEEHDDFRKLNMLKRMGFKAVSSIGGYYMMSHTHEKEHVEWMSQNRLLKITPRREQEGNDWGIPF